MRKYFLFNIDKEYYPIYKNNPYTLYKTLEKLYNLKSNEISYGLSIFNQICKTYNKNILTDYIEKKYEKLYKNNNKYYIKNENLIIEINYSVIVILTNLNLPNILMNLNYYSKNIFVCDFINKDYFWINDYKKDS